MVIFFLNMVVAGIPPLILLFWLQKIAKVFRIKSTKKNINLNIKYKGLWMVKIHQKMPLLFRNMQICRVAGDI